MARKPPSNAFTAASPAGDAPTDAGPLLSDWLTTQGTLFSICVGQLTSGQMALLTTCYELQRDLSQQWQARAAEMMRLALNARDGSMAAWTATPAAFYQPVRGMLDDLWSQWSSLSQRGGEQLA